MLDVERLSLHFGGLAALDDLTFSVREREIVALIGPNGAGKTTVFNVVTGLYRPSSGTATFRGADLVGLPPHEISARGIARTFQNTELFRRLTALDNVLVGLHGSLRRGPIAGALAWPSARREEAAARRRAEGLLTRLGLETVADAEAASLPLGMQKRLELARALAARPSLLLLDEPAGGLNPSETLALMDVIAALRADDGLTILVVEHDMQLVMGLCDRVVVLDHGRKIADGAPWDIAVDPAVVEAYLGSPDALEEADAAP